eukprot:GGOE01040498.1.p1 GENE.GGOE01040498.1~~GGOE01040498.1.p1  ORF type:complete len:334 (-),score=51.63 GGOE01040498.1:100-996(-)
MAAAPEPEPEPRASPTPAVPAEPVCSAVASSAAPLPLPLPSPGCGSLPVAPHTPTPTPYSFLSPGFLQELAELLSMSVEQFMAAPPDNPKFRLVRERGIAGSPFAPASKRRKPMFVFAADSQPPVPSPAPAAAEGSRTPPHGSSDFIEDDDVVEVETEPFLSLQTDRTGGAAAGEPLPRGSEQTLSSIFKSGLPEGLSSRRAANATSAQTIGGILASAQSRPHETSASASALGTVARPTPPAAGTLKVSSVEALVATLPPGWCCKLSTSRKQFYFYRKNRPQESISWKHPVQDCYCIP